MINTKQRVLLSYPIRPLIMSMRQIMIDIFCVHLYQSTWGILRVETRLKRQFM